MKVKTFLKLLSVEYRVFISVENTFSVKVSNEETRDFQEEYALWLIEPDNKERSIEKLMEQLPDWVINAKVKYWLPIYGDECIPKKYDNVPITVIGISDNINGPGYYNPFPIANFEFSYAEDEEVDDWVE